MDHTRFKLSRFRTGGMVMQRIDAFGRVYGNIQFRPIIRLLNPKIDRARDLPDLIQEITRELKVSPFIGYQNWPTLILAR